MGYALWLVPTPAQIPTVQAVQATLRQLHPTSPSFHPHVTLLSGFDLATSGGADKFWQDTLEEVDSWRKERVGGGQGSLDVQLADVTTRHLFFQCILAALQEDPSLMGLNTRLRKRFDLDSTLPPYFPHLSLLYGDLTPQQIKSSIEELFTQGFASRTESGVELSDGSQGTRVGVLSLASVELWDCSGKPEEWTRMRALTL